MALLEVVNFPHVQIIPFFLAGANFMNLTCSHCARSAMKRCLLSSRRDWKKQSRQLAESSSLKTEHFNIYPPIYYFILVNIVLRKLTPADHFLTPSKMIWATTTLTLELLPVTNTEFLLTISTQCEAEKWQE